ncbi:MAG: hypothetical protein ACK4XM_09030, partial [Chloroherpetonaceae bacterium]
MPVAGHSVVFNNVTGTITNIPTTPSYHINNFTVSGTGTVTLAGDLQIRGNLDVGANSVFVGGTGTTITFNGTGAQTIGGAGSTTFHNLTIDKSCTSTLTPSSYTQTAATLTMTGSITVNETMDVKRGFVSFCSATGPATFNHTVKNLRMGTLTSEITINTSTATLSSNTEVVVNNGNKCDVTLTILEDLSLPADSGGATFAITTPIAIEGSATLNVGRHINILDTMVFSLNGRFNEITSTSNPVPNPIIMNVGTLNTA